MKRIALLAALAGPAGAAQDFFEADKEMMFVRCTQKKGLASCEVILPKDTRAFCVAFGEDGKPLATGTYNVVWEYVGFDDLEAAKISDVKCRAQ